jgi:hypothetical protein
MWAAERHACFVDCPLKGGKPPQPPREAMLWCLFPLQEGIRNQNHYHLMEKAPVSPPASRCCASIPRGQPLLRLAHRQLKWLGISMLQREGGTAFNNQWDCGCRGENYSSSLSTSEEHSGLWLPWSPRGLLQGFAWYFSILPFWIPLLHQFFSGNTS